MIDFGTVFAVAAVAHVLGAVYVCRARNTLIDNAIAGDVVTPPNLGCRASGCFAVYYWEGSSKNCCISFLLQLVCCWPLIWAWIFLIWKPSSAPQQNGILVGPAVRVGVDPSGASAIGKTGGGKGNSQQAWQDKPTNGAESRKKQKCRENIAVDMFKKKGVLTGKADEEVWFKKQTNNGMFALNEYCAMGQEEEIEGTYQQRMIKFEDRMERKAIAAARGRRDSQASMESEVLQIKVPSETDLPEEVPESPEARMKRQMEYQRNLHLLAQEAPPYVYPVAGKVSPQLTGTAWIRGGTSDPVQSSTEFAGGIPMRDKMQAPLDRQGSYAAYAEPVGGGPVNPDEAAVQRLRESGNVNPDEVEAAVRRTRELSRTS